MGGAPPPNMAAMAALAATSVPSGLDCGCGGKGRGGGGSPGAGRQKNKHNSHMTTAKIHMITITVKTKERAGILHKREKTRHFFFQYHMYIDKHGHFRNFTL